MKVLSSLEGFRPEGPAAVAVGVFDGFHLGHARIAEELVCAGRELGLAVCVLTFRTHPRRVLAGAPLDLITSLEHRLSLLERAGVDVTLTIDFTRELASLSAQAFVADVLSGRLGARALVLGHDARIGAGREADPERIREIARPLGIEVRVVDAVLVAGLPVSSTRVREAIQAGDLQAAGSLLGRRVSVMGNVVPGEGRGRRLGFPTANLDLHREVRPPWGVYATWAHVAGARIASVTNVGFRPTFASAESGAGTGVRPDLLIEAHFLDPVPRDVYGEAIEIEFVKKLRDERRFGTDSELSGQIARDAARAREVLDQAPSPERIAPRGREA